MQFIVRQLPLVMLAQICLLQTVTVIHMNERGIQRKRDLTKSEGGGERERESKKEKEKAREEEIEIEK